MPMEQMSPDEMGEMEKMAGKSDASPITGLVQQVGQGLSKLNDALNQSEGTTDEDRNQMAQILSMYIDLVEKKLGSAPGESPEEEGSEMQGQGQIPAMQGRGGVPMGPQTRS